MNAGDTASIQCTVTKGDLPLKIQWYQNRKPVHESQGIMTSYQGKRTSSLIIDSVQAEHIGKYTCSATNAAGSTNSTAHLNVNGTGYQLRFYACYFLIDS